MRRTAVELEAAEPRLGGRRRHEGVGRGESLLGGQRVEFLGELLAVGVDFLLLSFLGMRERLVELLLHARLADHDQRRLAGERDTRRAPSGASLTLLASLAAPRSDHSTTDHVADRRRDPDDQRREHVRLKAMNRKPANNGVDDDQCDDR